MRAHDRMVAGIRCTEVLRALPDYMDGELEPDHVRRIDAHLAGCDWCERFGGDYATAVTRLRSRLSTPPDAAPGIHERLMRRLAAEE